MIDNVRRTISFNYKNKIRLFQDCKTQLILEKIKLDENPEYKNFLYSYFNDPSKYFIKKFKNNPVVVGKKYNKNTSYKIKYELKTSPKKKSKKVINMMSSLNLKNRSSSDNSSAELNKGSIQQKETNNLKPGQRFVDDLEINEIFSNFKNTQKTNKSKTNNYITINDIRKFRAENLEKSKTVKSKLQMRKKNIQLLKGANPSDTLVESNNNINYKRSITETNSNIESYNDIKKTKKSNENLKKKDSNSNTNDSFPNLKSNKNINNINLLKLYQNNLNKINDKNNTSPNESITSNSNKKINHPNNIIINRNNKKNNPLNNHYNYNFSKLFETLNDGNKIDIFKKQTQYLTTEKKVFKKHLAHKLVSQEKTFINNMNSRNKIKKLSLYMSNKLKIPNEKLLMNRTEYFRINSDLKSRLSKQMESEYLEDVFKWEKNLKNFVEKKNNEEIIRNPRFNIGDYPKDTFYSFNNEYLAKRLSKRNLKKFVNTLDNIKNNISGLFIEGKNLLELEHDIIKGIKGKKILNNYEEILPYSSLKDDIYANHFQI